MLRLCGLFIAHLIAPLAALNGADKPVIQITNCTVVFTQTSTDPKDPTNTSGYNLGPSIALLPDGGLMAVWFSSPSEGAKSQRNVQALSEDQGRTWGAASVLQDFTGQADFDSVLLMAGSETFFFFSALTRRSTFTSVAAPSSASHRLRLGIVTRSNAE